MSLTGRQVLVLCTLRDGGTLSFTGWIHHQRVYSLRYGPQPGDQHDITAGTVVSLSRRKLIEKVHPHWITLTPAGRTIVLPRWARPDDADPRDQDRLTVEHKARSHVMGFAPVPPVLPHRAIEGT